MRDFVHPTAITLLPRQQDALHAVSQARERGVRRQLVQLPTGVGKTILGAAVARSYERTLFIVPREELLEQTVRSFGRVSPDRHTGIVWKDRCDLGWPQAVGMVQTIARRLDRIPKDSFDLVIQDEAHHSGSRVNREVLDHFDCDLRLGLTATPERNDGAPLSNLFDEIVYRMTVEDAVREGALCGLKALQVSTQTDLSGVKIKAGDFNEQQLAQEIDCPERNALVAAAHLQHAKGRRAVAFCVTIAHAQNLAAMCREVGLSAEAVWGDDPDRADKIRRLRAGQYDVLCNAMLMIEGFDEPSVDCIHMARPTKSRVLYTQAVGRGLRILEGKEDCLIIDYVDNCRTQRLVGVWDFWGKKIRPKANGKTVDLVAFSDASFKDAVLPLEYRIDEILGAALNHAQYAEMVDLFKPAPPQPDPFQMGDARWHYDRASEKQLALLDALGYDTSASDWTKGQASQVLDNAPPSDKQLKLLLAMGYDVIGTEWTRRQAGMALDECTAAGKQPNWGILNRLKGR